VIEVAEMITTIQTPTGARRVTFAQALIRVVAQRAVQGHGPSQRLFMNWYTASLSAHDAAHAKEFKLLEWMEVENTLYPEKHRSKADQKLLNTYRKATRKP
jgi:hypothetical protein